MIYYRKRVISKLFYVTLFLYISICFLHVNRNEVNNAIDTHHVMTETILQFNLWCNVTVLPRQVLAQVQTHQDAKRRTESFIPL